MHSSRLLSLIGACALTASACAADGDGTDALDTLAPEQAVEAQAQLPTAAQADQHIPGFGGFYLDADGIPTVYLAPGASRAPAEAAFEAYLAELGLPASEVRVLEGHYRWPQLEGWQLDATLAAFAVEGAVYVDNDETANSVRIGVEDATAQAQVRAAIAALGIPDQAVIVEGAEPIYQVATLQNVVDRPVRAGVQINFPGYLCSVGFNATSAGQASFITASHCTSTQGGVESTPYWQPLQSVDPTQIATEVADPVYVKGGADCPRGKLCRRSDASRAAYVNPANQGLGLIASTSGRNNGSLDIVGSLSITSDDTSNNIAVGAAVDKVGRTTGWTSGPVTQKCVNTGVQGSRIVQLCQNFVSAGVGGGDSGSDVFQVTSGTSVRLEGVLWGGSSGGDMFVYSPLQNVIQELGPLTTH